MNADSENVFFGKNIENITVNELEPEVAKFAMQSSKQNQIEYKSQKLKKSKNFQTLTPVASSSYQYHKENANTIHIRVIPGASFHYYIAY